MAFDMMGTLTRWCIRGGVMAKVKSLSLYHTIEQAVKIGRDGTEWFLFL